MAGNKNLKPTPKKKKDAAKEGQTFKSKDLVITCIMLVGVTAIARFISFEDISHILRLIIASQYTMPAQEYVLICLIAGFKILSPVLAAGILASVLPGLMQTGGQLALKALKLKFDSLNPVKGIKKLFTLRSLKDAVKCLCFLVSFIVAAAQFWDRHKSTLLGMVYGDVRYTFSLWSTLLQDMMLIFILCAAIIIIADCVCEFLLYIKDIKMNKQEVDKEHKELNGDPKIKGKRKDLHRELLSEETKEVIRKSSALVTNPTHIAVGIYLNKDITFIPMVSLVLTEQRAKEARRYALKIGVPVVENVALARKLYATHKVGSFISLQCFEPVMDLLIWLNIVEMEWLMSITGNSQATPNGKPTPSEPGEADAGKTPEIIRNRNLLRLRERILTRRLQKKTTNNDERSL